MGELDYFTTVKTMNASLDDMRRWAADYMTAHEPMRLRSMGIISQCDPARHSAILRGATPRGSKWSKSQKNKKHQRAHRTGRTGSEKNFRGQILLFLRFQNRSGALCVSQPPKRSYIASGSLSAWDGGRDFRSSSLASHFRSGGI